MVKMVGSGSFTTWYSKKVKIYIDIDIVYNIYGTDHLGPAPGLGGLLLLQQRHEVLYRLLAHGHALLVAAGVLACSTQWYAHSTLLQVKYKVVIIKLYLEHTATATKCYIP